MGVTSTNLVDNGCFLKREWPRVSGSVLGCGQKARYPLKIPFGTPLSHRRFDIDSD